MSGFNPSQVSFAAGEWSPAMGGRVDLPARQAALARCENFKPRPQGPALMRAGSWLQAVWPEADHPRLFEFRVSGSTEDYVVAAGASKIRIYSKSSGLVLFHLNLIINGGFNGYLIPWSRSVGVTWANGYAIIDAAGWVSQGIATVNGHDTTVTFRARCIAGAGLKVYAGAVLLDTVSSQDVWRRYSYTFSATGASTVIKFETLATSTAYLDDVVVYDKDAAQSTEFSSPWTQGQLPEVHYSCEWGRSRIFFVHRDVPLRVLEFHPDEDPGDVVGEFYKPIYNAPPAEWSETNGPGAVESGFQGRLWLASSNDSPSTFWASKSTDPFDFDLGTGTASDGMSSKITARGRLEWMQGQRVMLMGSEGAEHLMQSASGLIKTSDLDVQDASGFGSSAVQARHIGDQVLFVDQSGRRIRALDYSWERQAWWNRSITWAAEHLFDYAIKEVHFSRAPEPTIFVVLASGELRACTYDRAENIAAWWRIPTAGMVHSAAVARTADGDELWVTVAREGASPLIERIPLHETGVTYLDSAITNVANWTDVNGMPSFPGANHLIGQTVRAVCSDGTLWDDVVVNAFGAVVFGSMDAWDKTFTVGLPYSARLVQLPLEGGLQTGSSQSAKRRRTKVRLRLNDSALPLVNGKRAAERTPADPMNTGTDLITGDVDFNVLGWDDDGAVTIEQDLPFRTEVVAIFGNAQANEA